MEKIIESLKLQMSSNIRFESRNNGLIQVMLPIYYEDGDMVDIFLQTQSDGKIRISDQGMTLMKLSYYFEINTDNKRKILHQMLRGSDLQIENGIIYSEVEQSKLYRSLIAFGNAILKISTMEYFKREMVKNLFYEMVDELIAEDYESRYTVHKDYHPIQTKEEYSVDYCVDLPKPVYIYAVKDTAKARLVTISSQEFKLNNIKNHSIVVYEDFDTIQSQDRKRILNATGKQFTSFDAFEQGGLEYLSGLVA